MAKVLRTKGNRWCEIQVRLEDGKLSISGSEGPLYHGKRGRTESCGQIRETLIKFFPEVEPYFKWHLNDMHAECIHQEARGETWTTHPEAKCGTCGYVLGSAWTKRELPADVVAWAMTFGKSAE